MLRYLDSFDDYQTADFAKNGWNAVNAQLYNGFTIASGGRTGSCLTMINDSQAGDIQKTLDSQATWIIGFAMKFTVAAPLNTIFSLKDNTTVQIKLDLLDNGRLQLLNGGGAIIDTSSGDTEVLNQNVWYDIELKVTIGNSAAYALRVNGVEWFSGTGDTYNSGNISADVIQFYLAAGVNAYTLYIDDLYILDGTGAVDNDFWGDVTILSKFANANGTTNNFTPSAGANWDCVNESTVDFPNTTDYVTSGTIGHIDLYTMDDLTGYADGTHSVMGVLAGVCADKTDAGPKTMCIAVNQGVTTYDDQAPGNHTVFAPSFEDYSNFFQALGNAPDGTGWTVTKVNDVEVGAKIVS